MRPDGAGFPRVLANSRIFGGNLVAWMRIRPRKSPAGRRRAGGQLGAYVLLRISDREPGHDSSRAQSLWQIIKAEGSISRPPTPGEREALEAGLDAMSIPQAAHGQIRPAKAQQDGRG